MEKKLEAFIRETGDGSAAVLTKDQFLELNSGARGRGLLKHVNVAIANKVSDLLVHADFKPGLQALTGPPHPTDIDSLLVQTRKLNRSVGFQDSAAITGWALTHIKEPPYRWELLMYAGQNFLHRGNYREAEVHLAELEKMIRANPESLGVDDRPTRRLPWPRSSLTKQRHREALPSWIR